MDEGQPTQFNMAIATLQRMDKILTCVSYYAVEGDLPKWNTHLLELRRTIAPFIKPNEYNEIEELLNLLNAQRWIGEDGRVLKSKHMIASQILDRVTTKIHRAMNNAGILMPKSDDPRLAIRG